VVTAAWPFGADEHDPLTPSQLTAQLTDWLGDTLVDLLDDGQQQNAHRIMQRIVDREGAAIARAWMIGMNPHLDDRAPVLAIVDGDGRDVEAAAGAYLAGQWT
jgi:hypothetical protein